jgi:hypothetical protein
MRSALQTKHKVLTVHSQMALSKRIILTAAPIPEDLQAWVGAQRVGGVNHNLQAVMGSAQSKTQAQFASLPACVAGNCTRDQTLRSWHGMPFYLYFGMQCRLKVPRAIVHS